MKKRIIAAVIIIFIIVLSAYFYKSWQTAEAKADMPKMGPAVVPFATAKAIQWQEEIHAIGTVKARKGVTLRAERAGRITSIPAASGAQARQGDLLFQIYPDVLKAQLAEQQANLSLAKYRFHQRVELYRTGAVSQEAYEQALAELELDQAKVRETQAELRKTQVLAPFDGIVGLRQVEVGDYVIPGEALATFQSKHDLRVDFAIAGNQAAQLHNNQKVQFSLHGDNSKRYQAIVYAINPLIHADSRMIDVRASIVSNGLTPGSYADVILYVGVPRKVISIPQTAVVETTYGTFTYLVVDGKAKKVAIQTIGRRADMIAVTSGLKVGDVVVSGNQLKVHDGVPVTNKGAIPITRKKKG